MNLRALLCPALLVAPIVGISHAAAAETTLRLQSGVAWERHTIDASSRGADGVKLADANGDGRLDVATGWEEGGVVRVYFQPERLRARQPWPSAEVGRVRSPEDAVLVDLDGDGHTDVVSATEGNDRTLYVHWAPTTAGAAWQTGAFTATRGTQRWMQVLPLNIDGRHGVDLVVGGKGAGASIGWLEAPARPRDVEAWRFHALRPAAWIMSLIAADLNGDGRDDLLFTDRKAPHAALGWLERPQDVHAAWSEHTIANDFGGEPMFLARADVDGDGVPEILVAVKPRRIFIFKRDALRGWARTILNLAGELGTAKAVHAADLDADGRTDLVFSCEEAVGTKTGVVWLRQQPAGGFDLRPLAGPDGVKFDLVATCDIDGDGALDVLTTEETDGLGVVWYRNPLRARPTPARP